MKVEHPITTDMQVVKDNSGNSTCLELSKYHAKIRRLDISEYGSIPNPTDKMHFANKGYADLYQGWHGAEKIKILPRDFMPDDDSNWGIYLEDDTSNYGIRSKSSSTEVFCFIPIPTNYKATHVMIYGNSTDSITVYEGDITDGSYTSKGTGSMGTEIDITDVTSSDTNYLSIFVNINSTLDLIYGGYVTIERV